MGFQSNSFFATSGPEVSFQQELPGIVSSVSVGTPKKEGAFLKATGLTLKEQLDDWWSDLDDILNDIQDGSMRGLERATRSLDELQNEVDVVRSEV